MTLNLNVKIDLSPDNNAALIERALLPWIYDRLTDDCELLDPDDLTNVLAIIEDVEVTVR